MNSSDERPRLRVDSVAGLLAAIPHLMGFTPASSLVVLGITSGNLVGVALRCDLPDPPSGSDAAEIAAHAIGVLAREQLPGSVVIGYGPGRLVTPLIDAVRAAAARAGVKLRDLLRVEDGRYWSYQCADPGCCPAEGVPFDPGSHPVARALIAEGQLALPSIDAVAAMITPVTGADARAMRPATGHAERAASRLLATGGPDLLIREGLAAVSHAIRTYRDGETVTSPLRHAWLALVLTRLQVRDDAWARMEPAHHDAHQRLWTDLVRRAQPGYAAAPACLLAITAWQAGNGALARIAIERALGDEPGYSMALLIRDLLDRALPPSMATPPMTPEEVAASYATPRIIPPADPSDQDHRDERP
jgi:hypothetical protein